MNICKGKCIFFNRTKVYDIQVVLNECNAGEEITLSGDMHGCVGMR